MVINALTNNANVIRIGRLVYVLATCTDTNSLFLANKHTLTWLQQP